MVQDVRADPRQTSFEWYFAALQHRLHPFSTRLLVRTGKNITAVVTAIKAIIHDEDSRLRIANVRSANELFEQTVQTDRLLAALGWVFGTLAVLLASAGIYSLLSYDVATRGSEIGLRAALGACRFDIAKLLLSQTVLILAFGLTCGGIAANALTRLASTLVFGVVVGEKRLAKVRFMITTGRADAASRSVKSLPARIVVPTVVKKFGPPAIIHLNPPAKVSIGVDSVS